MGFIKTPQIQHFKLENFKQTKKIEKTVLILMIL